MPTEIGSGREQQKDNKFFNIFGNTESIPSSSSLVSLRLLRDANPEAFSDLAKEETRFLASAMALVRNDPLLKLKLGGDTLTASVNLSKILRERAERQHYESRIDGVVKELVDYEIGTYGKEFKPLKEDNLPIKVSDKNQLRIDMTKRPSGASTLAFIGSSQVNEN